MASEPTSHAVDALNLEPTKPNCRLWSRCPCSLSIVPLMLAPAVSVMGAIALIAWFMIYHTASDALEAVGHQGQQCFVKAMRDRILAYISTVQRAHSVEKPRWLNTTCNGTSSSPNVSAFNACDDVRLSLWSQIYSFSDGASTLSVAFPYGSFLGYQRTTEGCRWLVVDNSTRFWLRRIQSNAWQEGWSSGSDSWTKPDDLVASDLPLNMTNRVWFTDAVRKGQQSWSAIFYALRGGLALPAVMPIYHPSGQLKLVVEADVPLQQLDSFFTRMKLTRNTFAFVVEMDGSLVASIPEGLSTAFPDTQSATGTAETRVAAQNASDKRIAGAAAWLLAQFGSLAAVPSEDSSFTVQLEGQSHFLFTGLVQDEYGLHWVIVIGLPRSDMLQGLEGTTIQAILIITAALLASVLTIALVTGILRCNLQQFAHRIQRMGTMDLEGAKGSEGIFFLSETRVILLHLRETIDNLHQFRTFLPPTMLDKVRQAEGKEEAEGAMDPNCLTPSARRSPRGLRSPRTHVAAASRPALPSLLPSASHPDGFVILDSSSSSAHGPRLHSLSLVHTLLERRMENLPVTLVCLELPHLHSALWTTCAPAEFMLWYEACLGTVMGIFQQQQGDFYRLMGDQLLFSWGAMHRVAAQCSKACQAVWNVSMALQQLDAQAASEVLKYAPRLSVVTGTVLCGVMGTATTRDMYLVGPLLRQGARLASLNGLYGSHILVDVGVAKQCETLFCTQVCGLVHGVAHVVPRPVQPVYELLGPVEEDSGGDRSRVDEEWMYRLAPHKEGGSGLQGAMDDLRRGLVQQAQQGLEAFLALVPDDRHARRMLDRISARGSDSTGLEGLVD